jgi:small basic protein
MSDTVMEILRALVGLFFDDELLAVGVLGTVALAALLAFNDAPLAAGAVLLLGNMLVLIVGAVRTARRKKRA